MDILWALILAFGIDTLDDMWVNWLNYRMATKDSEKREENNNDNNGVEETGQTHTMGFTQGWQLKDDGED